MTLWIKLLAVAAIAAALVGWGWTGGKASERKEWQIKEAAQVKAQLEATEAARAKERELQTKVDEANNALTTERAKHARIAAGLRRDNDGLRDEISRVASGSAEESAATCRERSETLGALLGQALQVSGECALEAEATTAALRAVLTSWPK